MTMSPRARSAIAVAALLATGLLAGCDDEEAPPEPTESVSEPTSAPTSTQTEPTPTGPVEPTLPPDAQDATKAGALAFVGYYWDLVSYSLVTGDLRALTGLAGPACHGCDGGADFIRSVYEQGGSVDAEPYKVLSITGKRLVTSNDSSVFTGTVRTRSSRQVIRIPGEAPQRVDPVTEVFSFTVIHTNDAWRVDLLETA